jgi:hypothetical protein
LAERKWISGVLRGSSMPRWSASYDAPAACGP